MQGRGIYRVNTDGTGLEHLVTPAGDPEGIALDVGAGKMYWAETLPVPRIMRSDLDGSDIEPVLNVGEVGPIGLALDTLNGHIYWTNVETNGLHRANLDGSEATQILQIGSSPIGLALDIAGGSLYWTDNTDDVVRRSNLDGTGIETLVSGLYNPLGIALDQLAGKIYWADHAAFKIQRANLNGSGVEDVLTFTDQSPHHIVLDVPIPEPATGLLLTFGSLGLMMRKRR